MCLVCVGQAPRPHVRHNPSFRVHPQARPRGAPCVSHHLYFRVPQSIVRGTRQRTVKWGTRGGAPFPFDDPFTSDVAFHLTGWAVCTECCPPSGVSAFDLGLNSRLEGGFRTVQDSFQTWPMVVLATDRLLCLLVLRGDDALMQYSQDHVQIMSVGITECGGGSAGLRCLA